LQGHRGPLASGNRKGTDMAGSGPLASIGGWASGTSGWSGTAHNVFIDQHKAITRVDGTGVALTDLAPQRAKTLCEICGQPVINDDWPTKPWRHMTPDEVARYAAPQKAEEPPSEDLP
jgi:hypothetical protein